jgi:hypothetical protein
MLPLGARASGPHPDFGHFVRKWGHFHQRPNGAFHHRFLSVMIIARGKTAGYSKITAIHLDHH